ncbi:MAG: hypothetical protein ABIK31_00380 [candidate division WOR-3 bacterium]
MSLDRLVEYFISGSGYSYTSSNKNYYILGNDSNRYLIYRDIPIAYYFFDKIYVNSNYYGEIKDYLASVAVSLDKRLIPVSVAALLRDLKSDGSIDFSTKLPIYDAYSKHISSLGIAYAKLWSRVRYSSSDSVRVFEQFLIDYLKDSPVSPEINKFRNILEDLPDVVITARELSVLEVLAESGVEWAESIFSYVKENFVESWYDVYVYSIHNSIKIEENSISVLPENYRIYAKSLFDSLRLAGSALTKHPDLISSVKNLYSLGYYNFFTQFLVEQNKELYKYVVDALGGKGKGVSNSSQLSAGDVSEQSSFLDKVNKWKTALFSRLKSMLHKKMVEEAVSNVTSQGIKPIFASKISGVFEDQYNKFISDLVDKVLSNPSVLQSLQEFSRTSNDLYAQLIGSDNSISDSSNYLELFKEYLKSCISLNLNIGYYRPKGQQSVGLYSSAENIASLFSFIETINDPDFKDKLSKGYLWSGFDMKESMVTYLDDSGTIEIPLGFTKYYSRGESKNIAGYGELLRVDFDNKFLRVSTRSFFAKLIGTYDDELISRLLSKKVQLNRMSTVSSGKVFKSSSMKATLQAEAKTNREIRKVTNYLKNKTRVMFILTKDGNVVGTEQMSGEEYFKSSNIRLRGFLLSDLRELIEKIQSGKGIAVYGQQDYASQNVELGVKTRLVDSFVLSDLMSAYNRLEKYIDVMHQNALKLLNSNIDVSTLEPFDLMKLRFQVNKQNLINNTYIVIEMAVGDVFQFSVYKIYPIIVLDSGKDFVLTESSAYYRRVTPSPKLVSVSNIKGLDNSANETLKLFRKVSALYSEFSREYNNLMRSLNIDIQIEESEPKFIPVGVTGVVTTELNSVLERVSEYLGNIPKNRNPLLAIDVVLDSGKKDDNTYGHRVFDDDFFNTVYRRRFGSDLKTIFTLLSEINDLNLELFKLITLRSQDFTVEIQSGNKVDLKTLADMFGSEFQKNFSKFFSSKIIDEDSGSKLEPALVLVISNALKKGIASIKDVVSSGGIVGKYLDSKGKRILTEDELNKLTIDFEKSVGDVVQDIYNETYNVVAKTLQDKSNSVDFKLNPVFKEVSEVAKNIRSKTMKLVSILNGYRNEKGALFDLIKTMRVLNYLLSVQDIKLESGNSNEVLSAELGISEGLLNEIDTLSNFMEDDSFQYDYLIDNQEEEET